MRHYWCLLCLGIKAVVEVPKPSKAFVTPQDALGYGKDKGLDQHLLHGYNLWPVVRYCWGTPCKRGPPCAVTTTHNLQVARLIGSPLFSLSGLSTGEPTLHRVALGHLPHWFLCKAALFNRADLIAKMHVGSMLHKIRRALRSPLGAPQLTTDYTLQAYLVSAATTLYAFLEQSSRASINIHKNRTSAHSFSVVFGSDLCSPLLFTIAHPYLLHLSIDCNVLPRRLYCESLGQA